MSDANKLLIRCAWKGNSAFDSVYGSTWGPGDCLLPEVILPYCSGTRTRCFRNGRILGSAYCNPYGVYYNNQGIPGNPRSPGGIVQQVVVTFDGKSQEEFIDEYQTGENQVISYKFETAGCTYGNGNAINPFTPRPVRYDPITGVPIDPPKCKLNRPKVRSEYAKGQFIDYADYPPTFTPVTDESKIFVFTWCPDQNEFHVKVFLSGSYVFTHYTGLEFLQAAEIDQHETTIAEMQAEIDQLQANKTGTIKVVFV